MHIRVTPRAFFFFFFAVYVANMENSPIVISDKKDDIGLVISAVSSPHNSVNLMLTSSSSSEHNVPEAEEMESETIYVGEESKGGSSNRRGIELLPRQSSIDQEDEQRKFNLQSVITVSDSPPNTPESMKNAHAQATITAQTPGGSGSTESTTPHLQLTTINNRTIGESTTITIESPPSTMHVHPTTMSWVANQESSSAMQLLVGASAQTVGNGNNSESTQPTASQIPLTTVNAKILEQVVKLAALSLKKQKPEDENAENYEVYLY